MLRNRQRRSQVLMASDTPDASRAVYTYRQVVARTRPLPARAVDPRHHDHFVNVKITYFSDSMSLFAMIKQQPGYDTGNVLTCLGVASSTQTWDWQ